MTPSALSIAAIITTVLAGAGFVKLYAVYRDPPPRTVLYLVPLVGTAAAAVLSLAATVAG
jgi:hypothetical protein